MITARNQLLLFLTAFFFVPAVLLAGDGALSIPKVAQRILEEDGYKFFNFTTDEPAALVLTVTLNGRVAGTFDIRPSKEVVLAIKLGEANIVQAIHIYYASGSEVRRYAGGLGEVAFTTVIFSNPIEIDKPFLMLKSAKDSLVFKVLRK